MEPQEIYNEIENAWKDAAVSVMVLKEITEGRQKPNPEAFTFEQQLKGWERASKKLRGVLDALADLKTEESGEPRQGGEPSGLVCKNAGKPIEERDQ